MGKLRRVVFCGNSLFSAGLEASLRGREGLETIWLEASQADICKSLGDLHPDVVILDLTSHQSELAISILREHPGVLVIGLDPNNNAATVLSSHKHNTPTAAALARLLLTESGTEGHMAESTNGHEEGPHDSHP